jgi:isopenicillin-N N-acyltransferase like protein
MQWMKGQEQNLVPVTIRREGRPTIKMVTEAGIIRKIGFNSCGVGVCFNAIVVKGLDSSRLPVYLGLRKVLESTSVDEAVASLEEVGMASSGHILIADASGATGLEFTSTTLIRLQMDSRNRVYHSNHLLGDHNGAIETQFAADSQFRVDRLRFLTGAFDSASDTPSWDEFSRLFEDQSNFPAAICRSQEGDSKAATHFNIVMDLEKKHAVVRLGRPVLPEEILELSFCSTVPKL